MSIIRLLKGICLSKLDKEKEKIGVIKLWLSIIIAILVGILGWSFNHIVKLDLVNFALSQVTKNQAIIAISIVGVVIVLGITILFLSKILDKKINNLEDL